MFLSTRQMRRFGELVADVIDDMLAADFEDGFALVDGVPDEIPGAETAFRELTRTTGTLPYDWSVDTTTFANAGHEAAPIAGWERRHARAITAAAATRHSRRRPGQADAAPTPCLSPVRSVDGGSSLCR